MWCDFVEYLCVLWYIMVIDLPWMHLCHVSSQGSALEDNMTVFWFHVIFLVFTSQIHSLESWLSMCHSFAPNFVWSCIPALILNTVIVWIFARYWFFLGFLFGYLCCNSSIVLPLLHDNLKMWSEWWLVVSGNAV